MLAPIHRTNVTEPFRSALVSTPCGADEVFVYSGIFCLFWRVSDLGRAAKADRKVNKGKRYLLIPLHTPFEVTKTR